MIPKRVTLENFLSFGEKQEIVFDQDEVLWVISGPNGCGKSAVFDAMTYCLFGTHRATGARITDKDNNLIRHGRNSFSIGFEFEFCGIDYRITRGRSKSSSRPPTPTIERRKTDGCWERVPLVNSVGELNDWVVSTLGLNSEQFQASVLLRQGKADAFVDAKPTMRFEILKGILNMEQYEKLAERVGERLREANRELITSRNKLAGKEKITPEQLTTAANQAAQSELEKKQCEDALQQATANKTHAGQWNTLLVKKGNIETQIKQATLLLDQSEKIENGHARWKQLSETLPRLKSMLDLRSKLQLKDQLHSKDQLRKAELEHERLSLSGTNQQVTEELEQLQAQTTKLAQKLQQRATEGKESAARLAAAKELADQEKQANAFPVSLDQDLLVAKESHGQAVYAQANANDEVTRLRTLLIQAEEHHAKIIELKIGVNCSACGQPVTAEHAEKERQLSQAKLKQAQQSKADAEHKLTTADQELVSRTTQIEALQKQELQRARLIVQLETTRRNYQALGEIPSPNVLEKQVNDLRKQYQADQQALKTVETRHGELASQQKTGLTKLKSLETQLSEQTTQLQTLSNEIAGLKGQLTTVEQLLPGDMKSLSVDQLETELRELTRLNIDQQYQLLTQSRNQFSLLQSQLEQIETEMKTIPEPARLSNEQAQKLFVQAGAAKTAAEEHWQAAREHHKHLVRQATEYQALVNTVARMEQQAMLLKLLDQKLGKRGLQLAMMSDAQSHIVELARQTLLQLTNHELSLELNEPEGDGTDQALDLSVRDAENAHVTPMEYLSGSQKFRVAIAIALAIGRYSAGQSRPLESVIIDEGFGSLDREGLNTMAEELKGLQRSQLLRRIILVSHQEEFVERFQAGYTLTPGEAGTTVRVWRR